MLKFVLTSRGFTWKWNVCSTENVVRRDILNHVTQFLQKQSLGKSHFSFAKREPNNISLRFINTDGKRFVKGFQQEISDK